MGGWSCRLSMPRTCEHACTIDGPVVGQPGQNFLLVPSVPMVMSGPNVQDPPPPHPPTHADQNLALGTNTLERSHSCGTQPPRPQTPLLQKPSWTRRPAVQQRERGAVGKQPHGMQPFASLAIRFAHLGSKSMTISRPMWIGAVHSRTHIPVPSMPSSPWLRDLRTVFPGTCTSVPSTPSPPIPPSLAAVAAAITIWCVACRQIERPQKSTAIQQMAQVCAGLPLLRVSRAMQL